MAEWPSHLLPSLANLESLDHHDIHQVNFNHAQSAELLAGVHTQLQTAITALNDDDEVTRIFFIVCAGENDISSGQPVDTTIQAFESFLHSLFNETRAACSTKPHLIFFGPKLEPWLDDDLESRKKYFQMSERMLRSCLEIEMVCVAGEDGDDHHHDHRHDGCDDVRQNITYIDCLTMFCGDNNDLRSGILSGNTKADKTYFNDDGLHLNDAGYEIWKEELEIILTQLICNEECSQSLDRSIGKSIEL